MSLFKVHDFAQVGKKKAQIRNFFVLVYNRMVRPSNKTSRFPFFWRARRMSSGLIGWSAPKSRDGSQ